ncbi:MAG: hypothetical protein WAO83_19305 [Fuerstiella sp.]
MLIELHIGDLVNQAIKDLEKKFDGYRVVAVSEVGDDAWNAVEPDAESRRIGENSVTWDFTLLRAEDTGLCDPERIHILLRPVAEILYGDSAFFKKFEVEAIDLRLSGAERSALKIANVDTDILDTVLVVYTANSSDA